MNNKQKTLIVALVLIIIASVATVIYAIAKNNKEEEPFKIEGIEVAENKSILKDTKVDNINITNVSLLTRNGLSTYKAIATNNTEKDIHIDKLYITFSINDKEKKMEVLNNVTIKAGESNNITISFESDMKSTSKIEYSIEKSSK